MLREKGAGELSQRVLSTDRAKSAAQQMKSLLNGSLRSQLAALKQHGQTLCSPAVWDGPAAARFRSQQWPPMGRSMDQALQALANLEKSSQTVIDNIMRAGTEGSMGGGTVAPDEIFRTDGAGHLLGDAAHVARNVIDDAGHFAEGLLWDGPVGMLKGLGDLVGMGPLWGDPPFLQTWKGIGLLAQPMAMPGDVTPESMAAWENFGKSLLAWDEWKKDPGRAAGDVVFNVVTAPFVASKVLEVGTAAKAAADAGEAGTAAAAEKAADAGRTGVNAAPALVEDPTLVPSRLPQAEMAEVSPRKFTQYSMDPTAKNDGKWKAWSKLGYNIGEGRAAAAADVERQLKAGLPSSPVVGRQNTVHGIKLQTRTVIRGPNGAEGTVVAVWQYDNGTDIPRMITNWLEVHK